MTLIVVETAGLAGGRAKVRDRARYGTIVETMEEFLELLENEAIY